MTNESPWKAALGAGLGVMANRAREEMLRSCAEDTAKGLLELYMNHPHAEIKKQCRALLELLCDEYGPREDEATPPTPAAPSNEKQDARGGE